MLVALDKVLLMVLCWREARGDGREAMRAVAHVVANRVKDWGGSWTDQITKPNQFSSMTIAGDSQTALWPSEPEVINFYALLSKVYDGLDPDNTNGAHFYANEENVTSGWYRANIMNDQTHPVVARIGKQVFRK